MTGDERLDRIARALHAGTCIGASWRSPYPCLNCPPLDVVADALHRLDTTPITTAALEFLFHDRTCVAGRACRDRGTHADLHRKRAESLVRLHDRLEYIR